MYMVSDGTGKRVFTNPTEIILALQRRQITHAWRGVWGVSEG